MPGGLRRIGYRENPPKGEFFHDPESYRKNLCGGIHRQTGDSFYLIAHKLGVPLRDLLAANRDIHPARLMVGDVLCIPREEDDTPSAGTGTGNAGSSGSSTGSTAVPRVPAIQALPAAPRIPTAPALPAARLVPPAAPALPAEQPIPAAQTPRTVRKPKPLRLPAPWISGCRWSRGRR